jgi:hypothetical protein
MPRSTYTQNTDAQYPIPTFTRCPENRCKKSDIQKHVKLGCPGNGYTKPDAKKSTLQKHKNDAHSQKPEAQVFDADAEKGCYAQNPIPAISRCPEKAMPKSDAEKQMPKKTDAQERCQNHIFKMIPLNIYAQKPIPAKIRCP